MIANQKDVIKVAAVQFRPVSLDAVATKNRILQWIAKAAAEQIELLVFPEACLAGYPFWICRTNGAAFEDCRQQRAYAQFLDAAVERDSPIIKEIVAAAQDQGVSLCLGFNERGCMAGRGTVYCSILTAHAERGVLGIHRKLMPTHDERLCWGMGDAYDLHTHQIGAARVGSLNCWENWMPLARYALYHRGEDIHLGLWPGNPSVSKNASLLLALEGRVWSVSANGVLCLDDVPECFEFKLDFLETKTTTIFHGGTMIISPKGEVVVGATDDVEEMISFPLDLGLVRQTRQSFDPSGHYSRSDVLKLQIRRERSDEEEMS